MNFGINKGPNKKGYVCSYDIERILTNYCNYVSERESMADNKIIDIVNNLNRVWD